MTIQINLENLLLYLMGCFFGISLVLWIIKSIIPLSNTETGGGGALSFFLLLIALFFVISPDFQSIFSTSMYTKKSKTSNEDVRSGKSEDIEVEKTDSKVLCFDHLYPDAHRIKRQFYVQIAAFYTSIRACLYAEEHKDKIAYIAKREDKFVVLVGGGFATRGAAENFMNSHELPPDAFILDCSKKSVIFPTDK